MDVFEFKAELIDPADEFHDERGRCGTLHRKRAAVITSAMLFVTNLFGQGIQRQRFRGGYFYLRVPQYPLLNFPQGNRVR